MAWRNEEWQSLSFWMQNWLLIQCKAILRGSKNSFCRQTSVFLTYTCIPSWKFFLFHFQATVDRQGEGGGGRGGSDQEKTFLSYSPASFSYDPFWEGRVLPKKRKTFWKALLILRFKARLPLRENCRSRRWWQNHLLCANERIVYSAYKVFFKKNYMQTIWESLCLLPHFWPRLSPAPSTPTLFLQSMFWDAISPPFPKLFRSTSAQFSSPSLQPPVSNKIFHVLNLFHASGATGAHPFSQCTSGKHAWVNFVLFFPEYCIWEVHVSYH